MCDLLAITIFNRLLHLFNICVTYVTNVLTTTLTIYHSINNLPSFVIWISQNILNQIKSNFFKINQTNLINIIMIPFLSSAISLLLSPIKRFIHADFHDVFQTMTLIDKLLFMVHTYIHICTRNVHKLCVKRKLIICCLINFADCSWCW